MTKWEVVSVRPIPGSNGRGFEVEVRETMKETIKEGGTIMPEELVRVLIRLTSEQHEWLRKYCFDNRISQAEVLRQALELYRQELAKKE